MPEYIKRIEDSPLYQYEKTMAINRCLSDYSHMDDASRGKFCLDKLGYFIVTQPHKTRAMRLEEGTGGALATEGYESYEGYSPLRRANLSGAEQWYNTRNAMITLVIIAIITVMVLLFK